MNKLTKIIKEGEEGFDKVIAKASPFTVAKFYKNADFEIFKSHNKKTSLDILQGVVEMVEGKKKLEVAKSLRREYPLQDNIIYNKALSDIKQELLSVIDEVK